MFGAESSVGLLAARGVYCASAVWGPPARSFLALSSSSLQCDPQNSFRRDEENPDSTHDLLVR
jgi:hypothetical protein